MHPVLFEIPGLGIPVRSFGVMVALGFLLGTHVWSRLLARHGDDPERDVERGASVSMWVLIGVLVGARFLYVIVEIARWMAEGSPAGAVPGAEWVGEKFVREPVSALFIWEGGLVMYGGMFGGLAFGAWSAWRAGLRLAHALDLGLMCGFLGYAVGRVGCLLVGDDYGSIVPERYRDWPFPLVLHVPSAAELHPKSLFLSADPPVAGEALWATQAWMSLNGLVLFLLGLAFLKRRRYAGQVALRLVLLYSVTRFAIEGFRGDGIRGVWLGGLLSTSQLISIGSFLVVGALLVFNAVRGRGSGAARA